MQNVRLVITIDDAGNLSLEGPVHDKVVCYGLLDVAREAVAEHHATCAAPRVQPVHGAAPANAMRDALRLTK